MNRNNNAQKENQILEINPCYWKFPQKITIHETSEYHEIADKLDFTEKIVFDLTDTDAASSSFIGFLININMETSSEGGLLILKSSESINRLLSLLELNDFFKYC